MSKPLLLMIDDDTRLTRMVGDYLGKNGFQLDAVHSLKEARLRLQPAMPSTAARPDLLILDLMLPDGDGLDLARELHQQGVTPSLPLLMLSAKGDAMDRIVGLELGADDYLPKPFEPRELLARIKALLRRSQVHSDAHPAPLQHSEPAEETLVFGQLRIDLAARQARLGEQICRLTAYQFNLLVLLAQAAGRVLTREHIIDSLKGESFDIFDRSIDVHISRIRNAIETDPKNPERLLTMRGSGYLFVKRQP